MPTKNSQVRIVFWGTSEFALPSLGALVKNGYNVAAVVTNTDEPKGRKQILTPPPVKSWIMKREPCSNVSILQPQKLDSDFVIHVSSFMPDVFVVASYGKIIPKEILDIPKYGALNIHPSLLPRWRGPSPIQYTILNGDKETGVTIMLMDEKMDHGPILAQQELGISKAKYLQLHDALANLGAELLIETLPKWLAGEIKPVPQDESKITYSKMLKKEDGKIDWTKSAEDIERQIRAFSGWPGSYTFWQRGDNQLRLEIEEAEAADAQAPAVSASGLVWQDNPASFLINTGKGSLRVIKIKLEGKKTATAKEFINGYKNIIGTILDTQ